MSRNPAGKKIFASDNPNSFVRDDDLTKDRAEVGLQGWRFAIRQQPRYEPGECLDLFRINTCCVSYRACVCSTFAAKEATSQRTFARGHHRLTAPAAVMAIYARSFGSPLISRLKTWVRAVKANAHAVYLAARDPRVPRFAKILAVAVAAYALSPIDLIPNFVPVLGYLDDLVIVPLGIWLLVVLIPADASALLLGLFGYRYWARPSSTAQNLTFTPA